MVTPPPPRTLAPFDHLFFFEQSPALEQCLRKYLWVYNWNPLARDPAFCEEVQMAKDNKTVRADISRAVP